MSAAQSGGGEDQVCWKCWGGVGRMGRMEWAGVWWVSSLDTVGLHLSLICDCVCLSLESGKELVTLSFQDRGKMRMCHQAACVSYERM